MFLGCESRFVFVIWNPMEDIRKKMRDIHDEVPPDYYDTSIRENPFQRFWHSKRIGLVSELVKGTDLMLDIGCGGGTILDLVAKRANVARTIGIDASLGAIKYASAHKSGKYLCADFFEMPFRDGVFGTVTAIEVLEHLHDPRSALLELNRCLKKGGTIVILVPNENNLLFRIIWYFWTKGKGRVWKEAHLQKFTKRTLRELVASAGFRVTETRTILYGMLMAVKAIKN